MSKDSAGMDICGKTGKLEKRGRDAAVSNKPVRKVGNFVVPLSASACGVDEEPGLCISLSGAAK
jgi:hypothetical protein